MTSTVRTISDGSVDKIFSYPDKILLHKKDPAMLWLKKTFMLVRSLWFDRNKLYFLIEQINLTENRNFHNSINRLGYLTN